MFFLRECMSALKTQATLDRTQLANHSPSGGHIRLAIKERVTKELSSFCNYPG